MDDGKPSTIVRVRWPPSGHLPRCDREMWLIMFEEILENSYKGWKMEVSHDQYDRSTVVIVEFACEEDAMMFRMRMP